MKLLVVTILAYTAVTSAQLLGGLGAIGSKVGGQVGSNIGLLTGTVLDTVPSVMGINPKPGGSSGGRRGQGSSASGNPGNLSYERHDSGEEYSRRGNSGEEYSRRADYIRERKVHEKEKGRGFESGRGRYDHKRGRGSSRYDSY